MQILYYLVLSVCLFISLILTHVILSETRPEFYDVFIVGGFVAEIVIVGITVLITIKDIYLWLKK